MTSTREAPIRRLEGTPALERLLGRLHARLARQVWLHGLGTVLFVGCAWLAFAFVADWGLRVPHAVRVFHGVALVGLLAFFAWRGLVRPLLSLPDRAGLALLIERAHPELRELLISAVQFQGSGAAPGDAELVSRVLAAADRRATSVELAGVLDEEQPRARFLLGTGTALSLALLGLFNSAHASIFLNRLVGGSALWPQRTHLVVDVPLLGSGAQVAKTDERIDVRVARGTDVPILVHADGVVPDEVTLHFVEGRDLVLNHTGGGNFRTLLRSCQENVELFATGGDDDSGLPRVFVEVMQPPDVEGVAVAITPPDYSGLPTTVAFNRDVEVLAGSRLTVHALTFPADATGVARLLPDDTTKELDERPFPIDPTLGDAVEARTGLAFDLVAEKTIGYRIELSDSKGLSNPDPGLFRIRVVEDRPPEIQVLAPTRSEFEVVEGGAIRVRARAQDDFGLVGMGWSVHPATLYEADAPPPVQTGTFELLPTAEASAEAAAGPETAGAALGTVRLEVASLGTRETPLGVDQRYRVEIQATDNQQPTPGVGRALPFRFRVVTPEELLRRMQDRLGQARLATVRLADLQQEKRRRAQELLDSTEGDQGLDSGSSLALAAALNGQRRVKSDAQAIARDLATVTEDILYARVDDKAGALLEFYDGRMEASAQPRFEPGPWRALAEARRSGQLGASGFAGNLVDLVDLALEISEVKTGAAIDALERAERAVQAADVQLALADAIELQAAAHQRIEDLLDELAEWDNFQNVLALTRDIYNRQKALRERTQQFASEK